MSKTTNNGQAPAQQQDPKQLRAAFDHLASYILKLPFTFAQKEELDNLWAACQIVRDAVVAKATELETQAQNGAPQVPDPAPQPVKVEALPRPRT